MTMEAFIFYFISKQFTVPYWTGSISYRFKNAVALIFRSNSLESAIKISKKGVAWS